MMKKLFVLLIKYMPTIQLVGMLVNNTLYKYDVNLEFDYIGDFLLCNSIANCSPSTFDTYVKLGIIPPGHKEVGFKELSWSEKDFDEATLNKVRTYSSKKGL